MPAEQNGEQLGFVACASHQRRVVELLDRRDVGDGRVPLGVPATPQGAVRSRRRRSVRATSVTRTRTVSGRLRATMTSDSEVAITAYVM